MILKFIWFFGVNDFFLVDNMPLVFLFFSKTFQKKFLHSLYYEKKNSDEASNWKEKFLQGKFFYPPPRISSGSPLKGLIPRQRNSSRETVYAKYGWLHIISLNSLFARKNFASPTKAKKAREFNRIVCVQPSVFRINSFSRRISLSC